MSKTMKDLLKAERLFDDMTDYPTRRQIISYGVNKIGEPAASIEEFNRYRLTATLAYEFWAHRAGYGESVEHAKAVVLAAMYEGILGELNALRSAIVDGDSMAALQIVAKIKDIIKCDAG